jgi:quercetin dioxygenase-like cupin family protein
MSGTGTSQRSSYPDRHAVRWSMDPSAFTIVEDLQAHIEIAPQSTVSTTVLKGEGARIVLFSFDAGEELSEHTAAMPVLLQTLSGRLQVTADGRTIELTPGSVAHLATRVPHSVVALAPSRLMLTMLDPRAH